MIYEWASVGGIRGLYRYFITKYLSKLLFIHLLFIHLNKCRGLTPTLLGIIPYGAISFSTNEVTKRMVIT